MESELTAAEAHAADTKPLRALTALPVYNEQHHLDAVLSRVFRYSDDVLVVNDGSTDRSGEILQNYPQISVVTHPTNQGYGAALRSAFQYAIEQSYDLVVTIDCDGQHEPQRIPALIQRMVESGADIVSGSRYLEDFPGDSPAPAERRRINRQLTAELNRRLGLNLTDAFCGFKAYRISALSRLDLTEDGYSMPLEVWVQAASLGLQVVEVAIPRIYLQEKRSFGGALDDGATRLEYYHLTLDRSIAARQSSNYPLRYEIGLFDSPCGDSLQPAPCGSPNGH